MAEGTWTAGEAPAPGPAGPARSGGGATAAPSSEPTAARAGVRRGRAARVLGGLVVVGAVSGVVALGVVGPSGAAGAPGRSLRAEPAGTPPSTARAVAVEAADRALVCPGPLTLPDATGRGDAAFDPTPVDPVTTVTVAAAAEGAPGAGTLATVDGATSLAELPAGGGTAEAADPGAGSVLRVGPGDGSAVAAGAGVTLVTAGDLRGLSGASCAAPSAEVWLVGGATDLESTATLVVQNPGSTPVTVAVEVWGPSGVVELGSSGLVLPPRSERAVPLGGLGEPQRAQVVHLTAEGGQVTALLQDSRLRGFVAGGTDLVAPGAAPALRQVLPGLEVTASVVGDPDGPVLRLLAPAAAGTATVSFLGPTGAATLPGVAEVPLAAGEVTEVPLAGLPAGAWTVVVDADVPVVAGALLTRPGGADELDPGVTRLERAWAAATGATPAGAVVLPAGLDARLVLGAVPQDPGAVPLDLLPAQAPDTSADGTRTARLRTLGADGAVLGTLDVAVPGGTTVSVARGDLPRGADAVAVEVVDPSAVVDTPGAGGAAPDDGTAGTADPAAGLAWALVLTLEQADGTLVTVLDPVPAAAAVPAVRVADAGRLGVDLP
ncbi:DUF5719 family protein [Cellulomonas endophytica]|uniref:DUF5719 family protein n=1 Tax=Cellulomonas endophytica TaxID=2494735 RepID=UPI0013E9403A|nr:DUF5719 family protein [Cellulomonas endophytica]